MLTSNLKVFVKIDKEVQIKLCNCKCYRALTLEEVKVAIELNKIDILIIEGLKDNEVNDTKKIIDMCNSRNIIVLFFIPDNNSITCGLADELVYNIFMKDDELYKEINKITGINVSINMKDRHAQFDDNSSIFDTTLNGANEEDNTNINSDEQIVDDKLQEQETVEQETKEVEQENKEIEYESNETEHSNKYINSDTQVIMLSKKVVELMELNDALNKKCENMENDYNRIISDSVVIEQPISLCEYEDIVKKSKENIETIAKLNDTVAKLENKISLKEESINIAESKIKELEQQSKEQSVLIEDNNTKAEIDECNEIIKKLRNEKNSIEEELIYTRTNMNELRAYNENVCKKIVELKSNNDRLNEVIDEYTNSNNEASNIVAKQSEKISQQNTRINEQQLEIDRKINNINTLIEERNELEEQCSIISMQLNDMTEKYNNISKTKDEEESETNKLNEVIDGLRANNKELSDKLNTIRDEYENQILSANEERDKANDEKDKAIRKSVKYIEQLRTYTGMGGTKQSSDGQSTEEMKEISYNGNAKIIAVYGRGSYGITTTVMSIVSELTNKNNSNVCLIDLDIVNPSIDSWLKNSPLCMQIPNVNQLGLTATSLGLAFRQNADFFIHNYSKLALNPEKYKNITYISGLHASVSDNKIAMFDYSKMLDFLGSKYDYIVVDLGKLNNSNISKSLIKNFCKIAFKQVVVLKKELCALRDFYVRINNAGITNSNRIWLFNLCTNTDISKFGIIKNESHVEIPYIPTTFTEKMTFGQSQGTVDKFSLLVSKINE